MRNDDYGRIERLLADGEDVKLEFKIVNHVYPEGRTSYNVIGEIPGTDKADEVVMLGGHLDSWHAATGATDNAIGCSIMLEAARLIETLGMKPRRTVRVALWSGEEEGLLGSLAYVKQHFGTAEDPKPEWARLDATSMWIPARAGCAARESSDRRRRRRCCVRCSLQFKDWGVAGASDQQPRYGRHGQHVLQQCGLPGIGMSQDPIEYGIPDAPHEPGHVRADYPR